jgi:transposase-like protein
VRQRRRPATHPPRQAPGDQVGSDHLGYEKDDRAGRGSGNHRNGTSAKTVLTEIGPVPLDVPRDRKGEFEPLIVPEHAVGWRADTHAGSITQDGITTVFA